MRRRSARQAAATILLVAGIIVAGLWLGSYLADRIAPQTGALQREIADTQRQLVDVEQSVSERERQLARLTRTIDELVDRTDRLASELEVDPSPSRPAPAPSRDGARAPEPAPTVTVTEPSDDRCPGNGKGPKRCRDGG